jgi:uncharacterized cupin superfamily protein
MARVPPGKESFAYQSHERDEEFLFILSGRGRAEINGTIHEVGPGDFRSSPTAAHQLAPQRSASAAGGRPDNHVLL